MENDVDTFKKLVDVLHRALQPSTRSTGGNLSWQHHQPPQHPSEDSRTPTETSTSTAPPFRGQQLLALEQERVHCTPTVSGRLRLQTSDASPRRDPEAQDITAADAAEGDGGRNSFLPVTPPALLVDTHSPSKVRPRTLPKRSRRFPRRSWPTSGTGERGDALCTSPETVG
jgi:hypothetical protein